MKKKIISLCLVIALVATAIAGATLAYFTDVTEVNTNTFTVGDVDIKLDETDIDNPDGDRVTENEYDNVYPGQTVDKDPMVTFEADSRDCYVRMIVTLDAEALSALETAFDKEDHPEFWKGELFLLEKLVDWNEEAWVISDENTSKGCYEFWYYGEKSDDEGMIVADNAAANSSLEPLFTKVTFPAWMTNDEIGALDEFEVQIVAHAMQAEGMDDQADAWSNWPTT